MDKESCVTLKDRLSKFLGVLVATESIQAVILELRFYNPEDHGSELKGHVCDINNMVRRIVSKINGMTLKELYLVLTRLPPVSNEVVSSVKREVNRLKIKGLPLDSWVNRLINFVQLRGIILDADSVDLVPSTDRPRHESFVKFWSSVSRLPELSAAYVHIPLSKDVHLSFPQLRRLELISSKWTSDELTSSVQAVFTQMPNLKILGMNCPNLELVWNVPEISDVVCTQLEEIYVNLSLPKSLVAIIIQQNDKLATCCFRSPHIDDQVLLGLSGCKHLRCLELPSQTNITKGLDHLTTLPTLDTLRLHYTIIKYINTDLILNFLPCKALQVISITANQNCGEFKEPRLAFKVEEYLYSYIERYNTGGINEYIIRLDKLRENSSLILIES